MPGYHQDDSRAFFWLSPSLNACSKTRSKLAPVGLALQFQQPWLPVEPRSQRVVLLAQLQLQSPVVLLAWQDVLLPALPPWLPAVPPAQQAVLPARSPPRLLAVLLA